MQPPIISPEKANILELATAGAFVSILMQPKVGWRLALTIFLVGNVTAYIFGMPAAAFMAHWTNTTTTDCVAPASFTVGFGGMYFCSAAVVVMKKFAADPLAIFERIRRVWSDGNGPDKNA